MAKFPEAEARLIKGRFVCRRCNSILRSTNIRILEGKVKCRKCNYRGLRSLRKK
ncbi:MAG: 50S ribosomal protein L40e [Nanoarchaeota archaeon]